MTSLGLHCILRSAVREVDAGCSGALKYDARSQCLANNIEVRSILIGLEISPRRVTSLASIRSSTTDSAKCVVEPNMVATPGIHGLIGESSGLIASLDEIVLDGQSPVIEAGAHRATRAVILANKWHGRAVGDALINGLQSLVLPHVLLHIGG